MGKSIYLCLLCNFLGFFESVYVHLYKQHTQEAAPFQCNCGFVAVKAAGIRRHQHRTGCHGPVHENEEVIPRKLMMRKATQTEREQYPTDQAAAVSTEPEIGEERVSSVAGSSNSFLLDSSSSEELDYDDESQQLRELREENRQLKKQNDELLRINDCLSGELLTPESGVPHVSALSGFEQAGRDNQRSRSQAALFPDPPIRIRSVVSVPETNRHLTRTQQIWKRCSQDAVSEYNKRHKNS